MAESGRKLEPVLLVSGFKSSWVWLGGSHGEIDISQTGSCSGYEFYGSDLSPNPGPIRPGKKDRQLGNFSRAGTGWGTVLWVCVFTLARKEGLAQ